MRKLLLSLLITAVPAQATVNANLDRYSVIEGNTIRLTLESDQAGALSPDLSPLHKEFQILGSKKMSISSKSSGTRQFSARWQVLLRPKLAGNLKIPPLHIGNEQSTEMEVIVERAGRPTNKRFAEFAQATLELTSDSTALYQESQMTVTMRLTDHLALPPEHMLKAPLVENASVLPFGEATKRQSVRKGQVYNLMERRFLIFPHSSGQMTLPSQSLVLVGQDSSLRQIESAPLTIDVRPAAHQQNRGYWLPASRVTLESDLSTQYTMELGQSLEHTLTLTAEGIRASSLPALMPLKNELAQIEIVDVQLNEQLNSTGLISTRTETVRITPHERGEVTLPAISIPWWDTVQDRSQTVELPLTQITVNASSLPETASMTDTGEQEKVDQSEQGLSGTVIGLLAALFTAVAAFAGWIYSKRRKGAAEAAKAEALSADQEADAFETLTLACHQTDPFLAQQALVYWAQHFWADFPIQNCADISQMAGSETFDMLIADLEQHIYDDAEDWHGDLLLQAVSTLRSLSTATNSETI